MSFSKTALSDRLLIIPRSGQSCSLSPRERARVRRKSARSLSAAWFLAWTHWSTILRHRLRCSLLQLAPNGIANTPQTSVPKPQHFNSTRCQPSVSFSIKTSLLRSPVLPSIEFDTEHRFQTKQIEDVRPIRMLPSELVSRKVTVTEPIPQQLFCPRIILTQSACDSREFRRSDTCTLEDLGRTSISKSPSPSPRPSPSGRGRSFIAAKGFLAAQDSIQRWDSL